MLSMFRYPLCLKNLQCFVVAFLALANTNLYAAGAKIQELTWIDEKHLERQRKSVDLLTREYFARPIRGEKSDLGLLQRLVDDELIKRTHKQQLQALGVVIGDIYVKELNLEWRVYEDEAGRSRAVCRRRSSDCIFPVTMLSRRIEAGAKPDVQRVYKKGYQLIFETFPRTPYSVSDTRKKQ